MDTNQNTGTAITGFYIEFSWMDPDLQQKELGSATLLHFHIPNLFWLNIFYIKEPVAIRASAKAQIF
jgi:hypothetical protein